MAKTKVTTRRVLLTALAVDLFDILMNAAVALLTGSAVVMAKLLQGTADLVVDIMLLLGFSHSKKRSTKRHPFGFGKETYFWAIMAGVFIFFITASLAVYSGIGQIINPEIIDNLWLAYLILSIGVITNVYSFSLGYRRLMKGRPLKTVWRVFFDSSHASVKTAFVTDLMGSAAVLVGLLALIAYGLTGSLLLDGIGAVIIGVLLAVFAVILLGGLKELVTGRSASPALELRIGEVIKGHVDIQAVLDLKTMVIGPDKLLVNVEVHLRDDLTTDQIEKVMDELKASVKGSVPQVSHIQIEPETP